jgi:hypothetical protein
MKPQANKARDCLGGQDPKLDLAIY